MLVQEPAFSTLLNVSHMASVNAALNFRAKIRLEFESRESDGQIKLRGWAPPPMCVPPQTRRQTQRLSSEGKEKWGDEEEGEERRRG